MSIKDLKNTTVMSVQKFHTKYWIERTYYSCSWRKRFNCDQCGKNFARGCYLKVYIEIVHENLWIQLWSLWQKHQSFYESDKTLDWNYKLQLFMKMKRFNFDQCGKNSARGCILNDHEIDSWIELWKSHFLDLKFRKGAILLLRRQDFGHFWPPLPPCR